MEQRQELMKSNGRAAGAVGKMLKGETPWDAAAAEEAMATVADNAEKLEPLWPEGSHEGDTRALPKIWENKADFEARLQKLYDTAEAAEAAAAQGQEAFAAAFPAVGQTCSGCHETYRRPES